MSLVVQVACMVEHPARRLNHSLTIVPSNTATRQCCHELASKNYDATAWVIVLLVDKPVNSPPIFFDADLALKLGVVTQSSQALSRKVCEPWGLLQN